MERGNILDEFGRWEDDFGLVELRDMLVGLDIAICSIAKVEKFGVICRDANVS